MLEFYLPVIKYYHIYFIIIIINNKTVYSIVYVNIISLV